MEIMMEILQIHAVSIFCIQKTPQRNACLSYIKILAFRLQTLIYKII
jgi:hypothetical protein